MKKIILSLVLLFSITVGAFAYTVIENIKGCWYSISRVSH